MRKKVIVASHNPVKINAVQAAFATMFPGDTVTVTGVTISSGVAEQPLSDAETYQGAFNRAVNAQKAVPMAVVNDALQEIDGQIYVFIVQPEGFEKKQVHIGISDGTYTEILSGLHQGDIYASENSFLLKAQAGVSEAGDDD